MADVVNATVMALAERQAEGIAAGAAVAGAVEAAGGPWLFFPSWLSTILPEFMAASVLNPFVFFATLFIVTIGSAIAGVMAGIANNAIGVTGNTEDTESNANEKRGFDVVKADISKQDIIYQWDHTKTHNHTHLHNLTMDITGFDEGGRFNLAKWYNDHIDDYVNHTDGYTWGQMRIDYRHRRNYVFGDLSAEGWWMTYNKTSINAQKARDHFENVMKNITRHQANAEPGHEAEYGTKLPKAEHTHVEGDVEDFEVR